MGDHGDMNVAAVPGPVADAIAAVHEEDAWMHADDLLEWMIHAARSEMEDGARAYPESLGPDATGRGMSMTFPPNDRHGERTVTMMPMLDDETNVLFGFTVTAPGSCASDIIMPDDIIKSVPHGARREDGTYAFDAEGFATRMGGVLERCRAGKERNGND